MTYQPCTLPKLPRQCCPFQVIYFDPQKDGEHIKARTCQAPARHRGWCPEHAYVLEVLDLACSHGYPALRVNVALSIEAGIVAWELEAIYMPTDRAEEIKKLLAECRGNGTH